MLVHGLSLVNYRNYKNTHIGFHPGLNILIGGNAQGKTNILEAIFYAATGKSHRTNHDNEMILWGEQAFRIFLEGERVYGCFQIEFVVRSDGKKILKVNNQSRKKLSELFGTVNVVMFSPEDMMLVKGGPAVRRRFMDIEISQTSPFYCHSLLNYARVLTQRNNLLRAVREQKESPDLLDVWDLQMAEYGSGIIKKRGEALKKLAPLAKSIHSEITEGAEELNICYIPSISFQGGGAECSPVEFFFKKLKEHRNADMIKGATGLGPHRDDIEIRIGDTITRSFGSQGQQRTCALSLKLAELEFMRAETGEYPVLLLDDVMSELDADRRKYLLQVVRGRVQAFVTATEIGELLLSNARNCRIFEVNNGKIDLKQEG